MIHTAGTLVEVERLNRTKQMAWEHFRSFAEGRLEDCLALAARTMVLMKRFATAHELVQTVLFLGFDQSSCITSAELVVDGDLTA